jgi:predicted MPP superfamily phosphohydrolase
MNIRLMSDLHLEFRNFDIPVLANDPKDTLVLAGDIWVGDRREFVEWIEDCCWQFKHVVMVLGNHEFYGHEVNHVRRFWAQVGKDIENLHVLDDGVTVLDGVRFIGGTLWTDMNGNDYFTKTKAKQGMNDYFKIKIEVDEEYEDDYFGFNRPLTPDDTVLMHNQTKFFIREFLREPFDGKTVVVTHHLPLFHCIHDKYHNHDMNGAYASDLEEIFRDFDFDLWFHGHTHETVELKDIYGKDIWCNPRGYLPNHPNPKFDPELVIELE